VKGAHLPVIWGQEFVQNACSIGDRQGVRRYRQGALPGSARHSDRRRGRVPGLYYISWSGFWAPKRTPKDVIARLAAAVADAFADPMVRSRLAEYGAEPFPREQQTPEALAAWHKAEIEKWWPILKALNSKQD